MSAVDAAAASPADSARRPRLAKLLQAVEVEASGLDVEQVAALQRAQAPVAKRLAEPRDMGVEAPHRARRRAAAVEIVDQAIGRDDLAAVEQEDREQALLLRAERDLSAAVVDLECTEKTELHRARRNRL